MGTLYENIKSLCDEHKITGGKMCVALGLSKSLMTKLKNEPEREISSDTALKIANYFKVSTDRVLYGETEQKKEPTPKNESGLMLLLAYQVFIRFVQTCTCKTGSQTAKQYFRRQRPCV